VPAGAFTIALAGTNVHAAQDVDQLFEALANSCAALSIQPRSSAISRPRTAGRPPNQRLL